VSSELRELLAATLPGLHATPSQQALLKWRVPDTALPATGLLVFACHSRQFLVLLRRIIPTASHGPLVLTFARFTRLGLRFERWWLASAIHSAHAPTECVHAICTPEEAKPSVFIQTTRVGTQRGVTPSSRPTAGRDVH
jgi:hypothetical protein